MSNYSLLDLSARNRIRTDLRSCLLVEAGAGSGKTSSLVERMTALIREGECRITQMAAVTFTRKAAGEMKSRFHLEMEKQLAAEENPGFKDNLRRGILDIDASFIGTIHSYCALLLRERPFEAGLEPGFTEIDDIQDRILLSQTWHEYLEEARVSRRLQMEEIAALGIDVHELFGFFAALAQFPELEIPADLIPIPNLVGARCKVAEFLDQADQVLECSMIGLEPDRLQTLLMQAIRRRRHMGMDDLPLVQLMTAMDKTAKPTLNRWSSPELGREMAVRYEELRSEVIQPTLRAWREYTYPQLVRFVLPSVKRAQQLRLAAMRLNFQDLLVITAGLLRDDPDTRKFFQQRFTHLLVDEFQDTDPLQAEIMFYLTGQDVQEQDWRKLVPRPGSLFVVGDPKQSIYRFRRADINMYQEVKELMIVNAAGQTPAGDTGKLPTSAPVLSLISNFRSVKPIGEFVNQVFRDLLPEDADEYQAAFAPLETVRQVESGHAAGVARISISDYPHNRRELIVAEDSRRIAAWIRRGLDGGMALTRSEDEKQAGLTEHPQPRDFMILLRYKADMDTYAEALHRLGIPFRISGGDSFKGSKELGEVLIILRALLAPDDPVRVAAALRGDFMGWSDQQLWEFRRHGGEFRIQDAIPDDLPPDMAGFVERTLQSLKLFGQWLAEQPFTVALRRICGSLGIVPQMFSADLGAVRGAHLLQLLEILEGEERSGQTSPYYLADLIAELLATGTEEEIEVIPGDGNEVRLMNLHKAKGLEAPVVFLANPARRPSIEPRFHINRQGRSTEDAQCLPESSPRNSFGQGFFVAERKWGEYVTEIMGYPRNWDDMQAKEAGYLAAEEVRLLYVAATRARNLLIVSRYPKSSAHNPWEALEPGLVGAPELESLGLPESEVEGGSEPESERVSPPGSSEPCDPAAETTGESRLEATARTPGGSQEPPGLNQARRDFLANQEAVHRSSYSLRAAGAKSIDGPYTRAAGSGKGASWGNVIHRMLELQAREDVSAGRGMAVRAEEILQEEGRSPDEVGEVLEVLEGVVASPFWQRVAASSRRLTEVPFSASELPAENGGQETITNGVIDLAFAEADGWVIADYKTDLVEGEGRLEGLISLYAPQVEAYLSYWQQITGTRVVEAGIYFVSGNLWVTIGAK